MKRFFLLASLFIGMVTYSQMKVGVQLGYNTLSISSDSFELQKPGSGFDLAISSKYLFSETYNMMVEIGYFKTKLDFEGNDLLNDLNYGDIDPKMNLNGLSYGLLGNYNFQENIGVLFGPSGQMYLLDMDDDNSVYSPTYNIGLTAGLIGTFDDFSIDVRYTYGLTNTFEVDAFGQSIQGTHNIFNIRLTYYLYELKIGY